tara:strand:- start:12281 stop:12766 length:486 start_codon:yes stop_codon:yes gene_type:complete
MSFLATIRAAVREGQPEPIADTKPAVSQANARPAPAAIKTSDPLGAEQSKKELMAAVFADPRLTTPGLRDFAFQSAKRSPGMTADQVVEQTLKLFDPAAFTPRAQSANELALIATIEARDARQGGDPLAGSDQPGAAAERIKANWNAAFDAAIAARSGWYR